MMALTALDRCCADAKGSCRAEVQVQLHEDSEPLLFCRHHWNKHKDAIEARVPYRVQDPVMEGFEKDVERMEVGA